MQEVKWNQSRKRYRRKKCKRRNTLLLFLPESRRDSRWERSIHSNIGRSQNYSLCRLLLERCTPGNDRSCSVRHPMGRATARASMQRKGNLALTQRGALASLAGQGDAWRWRHSQVGSLKSTIAGIQTRLRSSMSSLWIKLHSSVRLLPPTSNNSF